MINLFNLDFLRTFALASKSLYSYYGVKWILRLDDELNFIF